MRYRITVAMDFDAESEDDAFEAAHEAIDSITSETLAATYLDHMAEVLPTSLSPSTEPV